MKIIFCSARDTTTVAVPPTEVAWVTIRASGAASTAAIAWFCARAPSSLCWVEICRTPSSTATTRLAAATAVASHGTQGERGAAGRIRW